MDDSTRTTVFALAAEGWSQRAIADELGMSRGAVWRALSAENAATEPEREPAGGISVVGGLIVLGVMVGVVLLGLWLESKRGQARHAERVRRGAG